MKRFVVCLCLAGVIGLAGCGLGDDAPVKYKVAGQVTFDKKPLPEGVIIFHPIEKGLDADSATIQDGKYSMTAKEGAKRVEIMASRKLEKQIIKGKDEMEQYIPDVYNRNSTLKAEVEPHDSNEIDFDLEVK